MIHDPMKLDARMPWPGKLYESKPELLSDHFDATEHGQLARLLEGQRGNLDFDVRSFTCVPNPTMEKNK